MAADYYDSLINNDKLKDMPPIKIDKRDTDKSITYNKQKNRLDNISGNIYQDETYWRLILWANEEYFLEFDIPDNTIIRVPWPFQDVMTEINTKINTKKDRG